MPETLAARIDFFAFVEMARKQQRELNDKTVAQLNEMLPVDQSGLVMAALEQRARFEDEAREITADEWAREALIAKAEWSLPRSYDPR